MEFQKGQKVVALFDIFMTDPIGSPVKQVLKRDDVYEVLDTKDLCCIQSIDVGFKYEIKDANLLVHCPKCKKRYEIKFEETIWLWSSWFRPLDNFVKELLHKLFDKNKNQKPIKIRIYPHRIVNPNTEPDELPEMTPGDLKPLRVPDRAKEPETI